ncbi:class II glutamine amidotransferase [Thermodesulfobacterium hveragerdense]|uniref:class II glutamine amidotransferase n=1 Tax=Thermodesulfobacterium hveragerdense TaxID=53424 RepID=UPI00041EDA63|nr:glutamine amidotransferase family protein [Thermodesulfobacterium hveragerdense]
MWEFIFKDSKDISGCGVSGIINVKGSLIPGDLIIKSITCQEERGNGLGAGFAGYGIYPDFKEFYALHVMAEDKHYLENFERFLFQKVKAIYHEPIPTKKVKTIKNPPIFKRYFVKLELEEQVSPEEEENKLIEMVMYINANLNGVYILSSGKNMGVFKGVGFPEEIAEFFKIDKYQAYIWTAHNRFPTNTPGWWGGAHPFSLLDWSIVHNGEISSYGTNKRYLELFGYKCTLLTDTEVVTYLLDLLIRRHKLPIKLACTALAPPFWIEIERLNEEEKNLIEALRVVYGGALLNGPFAIILAYNGGIVGLTDRVKLRPLVVAKYEDYYYLASEEAAIRTICPNPELIWYPKAGEPVIIEMPMGTIPNQKSYI